MKYNPLTRRMFLQGSSSSLLAIPFLSSLASKAHAQAATTPVRYVQFMINHGYYDWAFWPDQMHLPNVSRPGNVFTRPLSTLPNGMSHILNSDFDGAIRNKMNLIRGLHGISGGTLHNSSMPTTAAETIDGGDDGQHKARFPYSVDFILQQSDKFYKAAPPLRALRLTPGVSAGYKWSSFSWGGYQGSNPIKISGHEFNASAFDEVFKLVQPGMNNTPAPAQGNSRRKIVMDLVLADYNKVINGNKIASEDKVLLSNYADHVSELQRRIATEVVPVNACKAPDRINDVSVRVDHLVRQRNSADIAVAALACGATNIVAMSCYQGSPTFYDEEHFHNMAHRERAEYRNSFQVEHSNYQKWRLSRFAELIKKMDAFVEGNGKTLLDNSLVYCGNELAQSHHGHVNAGIITAGNAGGRFEMGHYIDYKDRPLNNFLVSLFNGFGLSPQDYEKGKAGFGEYNQGNKTGINASHIANDAAKRASLPFFVKG